MKILERNSKDQPKTVELSIREQMQSATFNNLLDRGYGIKEAADIATKSGCSRLFYDWLTQ